jgi:hypothetical protein
MKKGLIIFSFLILLLMRGEVSFGATTAQSLIPRKGLSEGWTLVEGPKGFNKKTLFQHINGQAELFLKYGYQSSAFAIYQYRGDREKQIELDIYDMGNVLQAFGVFSRFRMEDRPGGLGLDSYLDERSAFFYQGKFLVLLQATDPNPDLLKSWATAISKKITAPSSPPKEIGYFPPGNLKPGSIQYYSESLLGVQFLRRGFQGTYISGGKEFNLFLALFGNPQDAVKASGAFKDYLSSKGKISQEAPAGLGPDAFKGEAPYKGKVIGLQKGSYLLGAAGFESEKETENLLAEFLKNLK